ncbi:MAG TPA: peptidoglycan DD-metalloendopeptidase family protein [Thermoleophilaceae bacterium]|nr:peptidoglycan DD-metalloendopeptidase family protein [Thermoleophilaceae bacterium]
MTRLALAGVTGLLILMLAAPPAFAAWTWPLGGEVITPYRNGPDPYAAGQHRGIDIAGTLGAPVVAAAPGTVSFAGVAGSSGLTLTVRSQDGRHDTSYLHLAAVSVREGQRVAAGERLGAVGVSGRRSSEQPHLHFGVREAGSRHAYLDPLAFLPPSSAPRPLPAPRAVPVALPAPPTLVPLLAPRGVPVRPTVPVGEPAPVRSPGRVPVGAPGRVPVGAPGRVPAAAPRRAPVGAPGQVLVGAPNPVRVGAPGEMTGGARDRVPANAPGRVPVNALSGVPVGGQNRVALGAPSGAGDRRAAGQGGQHRAPRGPLAAESGHARQRFDASQGGGRHGSPIETPSRRAPHGAHSGGPDVGWALACLGLLLAAALVGGGSEGRRGPRRAPSGLVNARARAKNLLRPLAGRG